MFTVAFIILAVLVIFYFLFLKTEGMSNVSPETQLHVDQIYTYIMNNPDLTFSDYINFLTSIKNTNLEIIDNEIFVSFKLLHKRNMLSKDDILSSMKL
jgi:hypothetical protein